MRASRLQDSLATLLLIFGMLALNRQGSWWLSLLAGLAIFLAVQTIVVSAAHLAVQVMGRTLASVLEDGEEES